MLSFYNIILGEKNSNTLGGKLVLIVVIWFRKTIEVIKSFAHFETAPHVAYNDLVLFVVYTLRDSGD